MKRTLCITLLAAALMLISTLALAEEKPKQVTIGYLSLVNGQLIAKNLKYHEKEMGVPIKWVLFNSGRDVNTAMASGAWISAMSGFRPRPSASPAG